MPQNWSFWEKDLLTKNIDFLIVGAGIVGTNAAIHIKKENPKAKVVVLDRKFPGLGASTKNAGFACFGSASEILDDMEQNGEEVASNLLKMRWEGLKLLKRTVNKKKIDFNKNGGTELFLKNDSLENPVLDNLKAISRLAQNSIGKKKVFKQIKNNKLSSLSKNSIYCKYEAELHPGKLMAALHRKATKLGVLLFFGADVKEIRDHEILLNNKLEIAAKKILLCTNGFALNLMHIKKLEMVRNQVLMTAPIKNMPLKGTYHMDRGYIYFRTFENRLLIGGARNIAKESETLGSFGSNEKIVKFLKNFAQEKILPNHKLDFSHQWSGILGVGPQKLPIIKHHKKNIFVAVRLGGMGVAIGSLVGLKLAALVK